jgi:hypothetical protein
MKTLLKSFKIDEKLTKPRLEKQPVYNQFKNNIPRIEDYNFMADLIEMPETKNKNKYILVIVDLATNEFDIEALKNKSAEDVLEGSKKIFKRSYLKTPYASNFRTGDYRYSNSPRKITQILYFNDEPYFRYILEGIKNASYSEYQLIKSKYRHSRYKLKKIIGDRIVNNKREFLIWWDRYLKSESTFDKESELRKDGIGNLIDEYLANKN